MTRINVIDPGLLTNEHVLAEWRELPRIARELESHPTRYKPQDTPPFYTLGKGHVKFFRNKLKYLENRHRLLTDEALRRGMSLSHGALDLSSLDLAPQIRQFCLNDWEPTPDAIAENIERIQERLFLRKKDYHIRDTKISTDGDVARYMDFLAFHT
ncbi:endonuclease V N-glycosylase UV repair enzyme [Vibrio phage EniLVp02]